MQLDFWNNPLVVSAFRVQYRRGGLASLTIVYLLIWTAIGGVLEYYDQQLGPEWPRVYFIVLIAVQTVISGAMAMNATNSSMRTEVVKHTFDFQRITALSPAELLVGKLFGEPAQAYLLAVSTFPLGMWCWLRGAAGVSLDAVILAYLTLLTGTLMCGAVGLIHRLEPPVGKQTSAGGGAGLGIMALAMLAMVNAAVHIGPRPFALRTWPAPILGLLTPLPLLVGVGDAHDVWYYSLSLFGRDVPIVLLTPLAQVVAAYVCFHAMERRLVNPANPPLSKRLAYVTLFLMDALLAAMLYQTGTVVIPFARHAAVFCISHLLLGLALVTGVTPWRESLLSWVWRFRGRRPRLLDWWLGDRSENGLVLLTFAAIGVATYVGLVILPEWLANGAEHIEDERAVLMLAPAVTTVLLLSLGTLYQWFVFIAGRYGKTAFVLFLLMVDILPHALGRYYELPLVVALSPSAHFIGWIEPKSATSAELLSPLPLLVVYGGALIATWWSLRRRIGRLEAVVDRRLQLMGVVPAK
jgi:hypothetical protein